ncbi:hypothetical protein PPROV_000557200 [Pycnococcus provasolii]|uniref:Uncharacterized protein n=1 Tax=Pycnococcus provasolii TaxID=41880 RepID=A0A830HIY5_9CHLO|nr:hypothetical protein PPROV_000557200 [Pycnococcus provasolii]
MDGSVPLVGTRLNFTRKSHAEGTAGRPDPPDRIKWTFGSNLLPNVAKNGDNTTLGGRRAATRTERARHGAIRKHYQDVRRLLGQGPARLPPRLLRLRGRELASLERRIAVELTNAWTAMTGRPAIVLNDGTRGDVLLAREDGDFLVVQLKTTKTIAKNAYCFYR